MDVYIASNSYYNQRWTDKRFLMSSLMLTTQTIQELRGAEDFAANAADVRSCSLDRTHSITNEKADAVGILGLAAAFDAETRREGKYNRQTMNISLFQLCLLI
jgi:hypothetical protein